MAIKQLKKGKLGRKEKAEVLKAGIHVHLWRSL